MVFEKDIENNMVALFNSLSEKDRRRYAAIEAQRIGYGGILYIASLFNCDEKTIRRGMSDLENEKEMQLDTIRHPGGGRQNKLDSIKNINDIFLEVLRDYTAGNPMKEDVKWTNLTKSEIIKKMAQKGIKVSKNIVKKLLKKNNFVKRKAQKSKRTKDHKDRDKQFIKISNVRKNYEDSNNPIISIDSKKSEKIGELHRDGSIECQQAMQVFDHDFPNLALGEIKPYAIYDIKNNEAFVNIGTSYNTSELTCDSIKLWWNLLGKSRYPNANSILCFADSGGNNSYSSNLFKEDLQNMVNAINLDIQVCHYPPGASKWNPIEHRVFPHITRALSGVILNTINIAKELISTATTSTGLKVFTKISKKIYDKGRKVSDDFKENLNIIYDSILGQWNYAIYHDA